MSGRKRADLTGAAHLVGGPAVTDTRTEAVVSRSEPVAAPDRTGVELPPLPEGTYRIGVHGGAAWSR